MGTLCLFLQWLRWLTFFFTSAALSLSYSSVASYRSMLSVVFRFILPELSTHFVLHDLLRSFRLERPLSSSRVPPWDLLHVLHFLRGPSFEPLASSSLRDLTWKVLLVVWGNSRRFLGRSPFLALMFFSLIFRNFGRRLSLQSIHCLAVFVSGLWWISSANFRRSSSFVPSAPCGINSPVLLLFLHVLVLSLSLLALLLDLCLRTLLASFCVMLSLVRPLLLVPLQLLLLVLLPHLGLIAFVGSRLHGRLRGMLLFPLSLRRPLDLQLLSSPLSISLMSSFFFQWF